MEINIELEIVIDGQSISELGCLSNWESLVRAEIKQILKKNSSQITQSKRRKDFFQTECLLINIEREDFDNLVSLRNWEELGRDKIIELFRLSQLSQKWLSAEVGKYFVQFISATLIR